MNISEFLRQGSRRIAQALNLSASEAALEAQVLLSSALKKNRAYLMTHYEEEIGMLGQEILARRLEGEPVAYILGAKEFYGMDFCVSPDVLIPRPETELLVEMALDFIPEKGGFDILDLGTGSGILAVAIAKHRPQAQVLAADVSTVALDVARKNARNLGAGNVEFVSSNWFHGLSGHFDLIVSNPPYVAENDPHLSALRFEPVGALASGKDGLDAIRQIVRQAPDYLNSGGRLFFEHGHDQAEKCRALLESFGFSDVLSFRDIAGIERVSGGRKIDLTGN